MSLCYDGSLAVILSISTDEIQKTAFVFFSRFYYGNTCTSVECYNYISNSIHLTQKYAGIFVCGDYLLREVNSFSKAELEKNCDLQGIDNVQGQISVHIFKAKWRLFC